MTMVISGDGTITGLAAGGLPDATITSAELASGAVSPQVLSLFNVSGSAPVYACRAWVKFNGTGTVAINASGNVSSITDRGTGQYTVNLTTAMPDANYSGVCMTSEGYWTTSASQSASTASAFVFFVSSTTSYYDVSQVNVAIFR